MRRDANHAVGAHRETRQEQVVVAGPDDESRAAVAQDRPDLLQVAARLFDTGEIAVAPRELEQRLGQHVGARASRDVVDDDRQRRRVGDRAEVREHSALRRLVVVRYDCEDRIRAGRLRVARRSDRFARGVRSGVRDDRRVAADGFLHRPPQSDSLVALERLPFAGGSGDDQPVVAAVDQPAREALRLAQIERSAFVERRDHRREDCAEVHETGSPSCSPNRSWTATSARVTWSAGTKTEIVMLLSVQWMISTSAFESASTTR